MMCVHGLIILLSPFTSFQIHTQVVRLSLKVLLPTEPSYQLLSSCLIGQTGEEPPIKRTSQYLWQYTLFGKFQNLEFLCNCYERNIKGPQWHGSPSWKHNNTSSWILLFPMSQQPTVYKQELHDLPMILKLKSWRPLWHADFSMSIQSMLK